MTRPFVFPPREPIMEQPPRRPRPPLILIQGGKP